MQHEITAQSQLLDSKGALAQRGWSKKPLLIYNPENLGVGWHRLKEWDFYGVWHPDYGINLFVADLGYMTISTITLIDFRIKKNFTWGTVRPLTKGKLGLPKNSLVGDYTFKSWILGKIRIHRFPDKHIITLDSPKFKGLKGEISLSIDQNKDSTVVSTGYKESPHQFYYNHKNNLMPTKGSIRFKGKNYDFHPKTCFSHFDWGRGVWPYRTHWYWGTAAGRESGHDVWINIGYGFGDLSTHTENMIFIDGKCHKIEQVFFHYDKKDIKAPWKFTSNDGRLELTLTPDLVMPNNANIGFMMAKANIVYGIYSGHLVLDDGKRIKVNNLLGHAEDCRFRW